MMNQDNLNDIIITIRDLFLSLNKKNYNTLIQLVEKDPWLADFKFEFSSSYAGLDEVITHKVSMMVYAVSTYIYTEKNSEASDYSLKIINFLIKRGSNLNEVVNNKTILFYATPNPSLFTYLLERGARLSAKEYLILSKQKDSVPDSLILNIYEIYLEKDKLNHSLKDNRKPKLPTSKLKL